MEKPTLEDLLRLKRHEKPSPEFWKSFDRELRERTLKTVVCEQRLSFSRVVRQVRKIFAPTFPVAAAALIALAFLVPSDNFQAGFASSQDTWDSMPDSHVSLFVSDSVQSSRHFLSSEVPHVHVGVGSGVCFATHSLGGSTSVSSSPAVVSAIF